MVTSIELDPLVGQYQHEVRRPRADEALVMLKKIASMVKPIMRRHNWRVGILAEFYPSQKNLLGLNTNGGEKINVRLRYPADQNQFLPLEDVLDTMLHELCHNEIGPHNQQFHALWDQLRDEHEALVRKGYSGEGFLGHGDRLGGQRIPLHEAKRRARAAAEKRRTLTAGSGQRLGGSGVMRGQDPRAVIVAAIERRLRIERGCASGTDAGLQIANDEATKSTTVATTQAEQQDPNEATMMQAFIDLIEEEENEIRGTIHQPQGSNNPVKPNGQSRDPTTNQSLVEQQRRIEHDILKQQKVEAFDKTSDHTRLDSSLEHATNNEIIETWTCEICTLVNPINFLTCDACTVERPAKFAPLSPLLPPNIPSNTKPKPKASNTSTGIGTGNTERERLNAFKPRLSSAQALQKFEQERAQKVNSKPVGWRCTNCGNFMEQEWWTCSACGRMRASS